MRIPRPRAHHLVLVGLLLLFGFLSALLFPPPSGGTREGEKPSMFNDGPGGLRALLFTCEGVGLEVGPWTGRVETLGPEVGALVVVGAPETAPAGSHLLPWVRQGGRLLLASTASSPPEFRDFRLARVAVAGATIAAAPASGWTLPAGPVETSFGFEEGSLPTGTRVLARTGEAPAAAPLAVAVPVGEGEVVALADASVLQNRRFGEEACAVLAVRLVERAAGGAPVRFCETLHGYGLAGDPTGVLGALLRRTPLGHAVLGAAAFLLLHLAAGWPRFRRVRRTLEPPRRSEYEYLDALAGLLHHERAWKQVGDLLLHGVRRRLGGTDPAGRRLAVKELAGRIAWDRPGEEEAVREDLRVLAAGTDGAKGPGDMAAATARLDAVVRSDRRRLGRN